MKKLYPIVSFLLVALLFASCGAKKTNGIPEKVSRDLKEIVSSDTLKVATMYGSTSYFLFRDELLGFDYEIVENLANYLHVNLKITIARSESEMTRWLEEGKVDIVSYNVIETKALKRKFSFVLPQEKSYQVLVQSLGANALSDVTQLAGKTVYVNANTIFQERLKSLNEEIGGTIDIKTVSDSVSNDDLIDQVAEGKIGYTIAYHNVAMLHKSFSNELDCHMPIGFEQNNGWLIGRRNRDLRKVIEKWRNLPEVKLVENNLLHKYWEKSPFFALRNIRIPKGAISPFDRFFKKYALQINWDWRLLTALAYNESRFDNTVVSWVGAAGLMQLMPHTASNFGLDRNTKFDPERNIEAGVQYIKSLNLAFSQVENKEERIRFILAAYNSGPAHVLDAMALAKKYGKNPHIWGNQVEFFLLKKSQPEFYNDPVVKYGYFKGSETVKYVRNTLDTYSKYMKRK